MTVGRDARRAIFGAVAGLLYGLVLAVLSVGAAGGGHGTNIPLLLSSAPLSVFYLVADSDGGREVALYATLYGGSVVYAVLGWLVMLAGGARPAAALLLLHYLSGLALVVATGVTIRGLAGEIPDFFKIWAPAYLIGQLVLWWQLSRRGRIRPSRGAETLP